MFDVLNISRENNYEEWLKYRISKLTSTDAAKLLSKNFAPSKVVDYKLKPYNSYTNKYMEFGNKREPLILKNISNLFPVVANDKIFQHQTYENFTATPDGISKKYTVEVKTSLHGLEYNIKKYYAQIQWQMFITNKQKSLFVVEKHDNFVPQQIFYTFIPYDTFIETIFVERGNQILELLKNHTHGKPCNNNHTVTNNGVFDEVLPNNFEKQPLLEEDEVKW